MKQLILIAAYCLFNLALLAQQPDSSSADEKKINFIAGVSYNSALNYYGRTDSLNSSGIYPFVGINFKNGLYINSSFVFVSNALATQYTATIVEAGYQFSNEIGNWSGNIFGNAFFYKENSGLVQSALKGTAGINITRSGKVINVNVGGDVKVSDKLDFGASAGVDHIFRIEKVGNGVIVIDPSAYVYAGTQNFTSTYYKEKKFLFLPAGQEAITENSSQFNILSYELSCPFIYGLGKMNLILTPSFVVPQNLVTVAGRPDLSENGRNKLYVTATIRFTL